MTLKSNYNLLIHRIYIILLLIAPLHALGNDPINALFDQGNKQYAEAKYLEAVQSYQKILLNGTESATVYFNLGNAFFKTGELPSALLYYEKALRLDPGDDDIRFNIRFANSKTTDKIESSPEFFLYTWWSAFILFFPIGILSILSAVFFTAGFLILIIFLFSSRTSIRKLSFYLASTCIFIGLMTIFMAFAQTRYFQSHHQAIVFQPTVAVKSEPVNVSKDLFVIHSGTKVTLLKKEQDWIKIELANGNVGWIATNAVREI